MASREACRECRRSMEDDSDRTSVERRDPSLFSRRLRSDSEMGGRLGKDSAHSLPPVPITGMLLEGEEEEKFEVGEKLWNVNGNNEKGETGVSFVRRKEVDGM